MKRRFVELGKKDGIRHLRREEIWQTSTKNSRIRRAGKILRESDRGLQVSINSVVESLKIFLVSPSIQPVVF